MCIRDRLKRVGKQSRLVDGLRYTDEETIDIVQMVLAGKVNKHLVQLISKHGGKMCIRDRYTLVGASREY